MIAIKKAIQYLIKNPSTMFLIDGIGALLTTLTLCLIMLNFGSQFGMSLYALSLLTIIATLFCSYSIVCFLFLKESWYIYLTLIGLANLLYGILSCSLMIYFFSTMPAWGIFYFSVEMLLILLLVYIEISIAKDFYFKQQI
jgi:hypothetical protein